MVFYPRSQSIEVTPRFRASYPVSYPTAESQVRFQALLEKKRVSFDSKGVGGGSTWGSLLGWLLPLLLVLADAGRYAQPELGRALIRAHWATDTRPKQPRPSDWAHESRSIDRLVSLISPENARSQRVAERLGAVPTETVIPLPSRRETVIWTHPAVHA